MAWSCLRYHLISKMKWNEKWNAGFGPLLYLIRNEPDTFRDDELYMWNTFRSRTGAPQIASFMEPTWGPPGSCRPQMGPMPMNLSAKRYTESLKTIHIWRNPYIILLLVLYVMMTWHRYMESWDSVVATKFCSSVRMGPVQEMFVNIALFINIRIVSG